MLHHPCILRGPQQRGQNQNGTKWGCKCYITSAFSGVPNKREKIKAGPKEGGNATSPVNSRGSPTKGTKSKRAQKRAKMLHHPCTLMGPQQRGQNQSGPKRGRKCYITSEFSGIPNKGDKVKAGPKEGKNATSPLHSHGSPTKGTKSKRAQRRVEMLHHPCILGGPQQRRQNQSGHKRGRKCYITPAFSGVPNKGDKVKAGAKEGGNATSPLHSRGSSTQGTNQSGPKKRAEMLHHPFILGDPKTKGDKIRNGCLNPTFWGAHKWAEMLRHPCFLGDPQQRGENQGTKKKQKVSHGVPDPAHSPADSPNWGLNPGPFSCRGTALPTRVWA